MRASLGNGLMFNITWLLIIYTQSSLLAPLLALAHVGLHLVWLPRKRGEMLYILIISLFGLALDQLLFASGLFLLAGSVAFAPIWLSCLWPVLATTSMHAFAGLQRRPLLASLFGAFGGYGSYMLGTRLSAVEFGFSQAPLVIAAIWALLFPLMLWLAARLQQPSRSPDYA